MTSPAATTRLRLPDTLRLRLIIFAAAVSLPLAIALGLSLVHQTMDHRDAARETLRTQRESTQLAIENYLEGMKEKMRELVEHTDFRGLDSTRTRDRCAQFLAYHRELINVAIVDRRGILRYSTAFPVTNPPQDFSVMDNIREVLDTTAWKVSAGAQGIATKRWGVVAAQPLPNNPELLLAVAIDLPKLSQKLVLFPDEEDLIISVADARHHAILSSRAPETRIGSYRPAGMVVRERLAAGVSTGEFTGNDGIVRTYDAALVRGTDWIITAAVPTETIYRATRRNLIGSLLLIGVAVGASVFFVERYSRSLAQPAAALASTARAHSVDLHAPFAPVVGPSEIAETARAFNEMVLARRKAAHDLAESEARYRTIAEQTGQLIFELDLASQQVRWFGDAASRQIVGLAPEEFAALGLEGWSSRLHPDERNEAIARLQHTLASGQPCRAEYRLRHTDGTYRVVDESSVVLRDEHNKFTRLVGRMLDITERKRAEAERQSLDKKLLETQKLESLGVLAGGIAHDFNNLLTGILGNANLARLDAPAGWSGIRALDQIEQSSLRAAELCKQMLAYSGRGQFVVQRVSLNELVRETEQLLRVSISKKAVLQFSLDPNLPAVQGDATQLRQVVMNLVINAAEALGESPGTINLTTGTVDLSGAQLAALNYSSIQQPGRHVFAEVTDTGCGMDRATLARIFDPFFTTKFTGRGLGLAAVIGIVRGHHGAIEVESERGRGTRFRILLPPTDGAPQSLAPHPHTPIDRHGTGHILVVDDEPTVRSVAREMLKLSGFTVTEAADGLEAVTAFRREPQRYAAVLLDLTMPRMDGHQAFHELRSIDPKVKVVLMSGFNRADAISRFIGKDLAGFIEKPFVADRFIAELQRVLRSGDPV